MGRIEPGFRAEFILVADDPLLGLDTLRHPLWVMLDGQIVVPGPLKEQTPDVNDGSEKSSAVPRARHSLVWCV